MSLADDPTEPSPQRCPRCNRVIGAAAPAGLCPRCLLGDVLDDEPPPSSSPSGLPRRFGGYMLLKQIGQGGMGVVFEARQVSIDRRVALKRMRDGDRADAGARRLFRRDAKAAAQLDHPHIMPIYEVGEHDGEPYFTMKLMAGGTLDDAALRARYAEPRRAAALIATLARAVHACHRERIVHRDLKPENILFDDRGEPYVADFGVAKHLDKVGSTRTNARVGTVHYMAPEQARGQAKHVSAATDVWSLGVILYELVAKRPFEGPTIGAVLRSIEEDEPAPLDRRPHKVDRDLATVCSTCLQKDPRQRYLSAEALADDLERYLRYEPILAERPRVFARVIGWCRRHPAAAALLGTAAFTLVALTLWAFAGARAQAQARRAEVLAANTYAARAVAGTVLAQLDDYADRVVKEAKSPQLVEALARADEARLTALCGAMYRRHSSVSSPLSWWFIIDPEGTIRAHHPEPQFGKSYYRNYAFRDYFRGGMALSPGASRPVYISRGFRATTDDRFKVAIASPVRGDGGVVVGLLVAEIATDRRFGALELSDERRIAVLAVRRDRELVTDALPNEHILLVHDGVGHGEGVALESAALRRLAARRDALEPALHEQLSLPPPDWVEAEDEYHDPLAERDGGGAKGPWLAGVAPVGDTELAVIVQTRLDDATALDGETLRVLAAWSVGGAALLFASLFAALRAPGRGWGQATA